MGVRVHEFILYMIGYVYVCGSWWVSGYVFMCMYRCVSEGVGTLAATPLPVGLSVDSSVCDASSLGPGGGGA